MTPTRRELLAALGGLPLLAAGPPLGKPEVANLRVAIPLEATSYLPLYIAAQKTWAQAGLNAQLISFRGDSELSQALAGGSVDIGVGSLTGLLNLINANQGVIGFYAGFNQAGFAWYAQPSIKDWADTKGQAFGVSSFGSMTDALTRYVLNRHGLKPEKDVNLIAVGSTISEFQALRSKRIGVAIISAPVTWEAEDEGYKLLGAQSKDIAPAWPEHLFSAKTKFLAENPNTIATLLRAHVLAIRLARSDRAYATGVLVDRLKYTPAYASRAYDAVMPTFDERGRLPEKSMPIFWQISIQNGDVKAPVKESLFLDRKYIDSFASWAP